MIWFFSFPGYVFNDQKSFLNPDEISFFYDFNPVFSDKIRLKLIFYDQSGFSRYNRDLSILFDISWIIYLEGYPDYPEKTGTYT